MELYKQIKPLEDEITSLREANANNSRGDDVRTSWGENRVRSSITLSTSVSDLERRLDQSKIQLQESQTQLQEVDEKNFNLSRDGFIFLLFPPWEWRVMLLSFLSQSRKSLIWGTNWRQPRKKETELKIKKSGVRQLLVPHVNFFFNLVTKR